jgi:hypothetical protein
MMCNALDGSLFQEIYLMGSDSLIKKCDWFSISLSFEELIQAVAALDKDADDYIRIFHGVLTPAKVIPADMGGRQPFIVISDSLSQGYGTIIDACTEDDCQELALEIENILINSSLTDFNFEMRDVFILYGYEIGINLQMTVTEDDLDDEVIAECIRAGENAKKLIHGAN